jgi:hypothetical protein
MDGIHMVEEFGDFYIAYGTLNYNKYDGTYNRSRKPREIWFA